MLCFLVFSSVSGFVEGDRHPKVGVVLTSIALMYRRKAMQEHSSSILVQEVSSWDACEATFFNLFLFPKSSKEG